MCQKNYEVVVCFGQTLKIITVSFNIARCDALRSRTVNDFHLLPQQILAQYLSNLTNLTAIFMFSQFR